MCTKFEKNTDLFLSIRVHKEISSRQRDGPESSISPTFIWGYNDIKKWHSANKFKLNPDKIEFIFWHKDCACKT